MSLPPNNATLLRDPGVDGTDELLRRVAAFFVERHAGPYQIWSLWPISSPVLADTPGEPVPCMIRDVGSSAPEPPRELEIVEADDETTVRDGEVLIDQVFGARSAPGSLLTLDCLDEHLRTWVGYVDDRPVTTATAYIDDAFVGVYAVATIPDARGHGYGEAITWAATLCEPELPATLQASAMGRPIYERMGYRTIAEFTVWDRER